MIAAILLPGCASVRKPEAVVVVERPELSSVDARTTTLTSDGDEAQGNDGLDDSSESKPLQLTGYQSSSELDVKVDEPASPTDALQSAAPGKALDAEPHAVQFDEVIKSVYRSYPMLESALFGRNVAWGQQVGASGAFDLKLKGASENGPQGFYQTYRQSIGVVQPTYWGGEVFAGYRVDRGDQSAAAGTQCRPVGISGHGRADEQQTGQVTIRKRSVHLPGRSYSAPQSPQEDDGNAE